MINTELNATDVDFNVMYVNNIHKQIPREVITILNYSNYLKLPSLGIKYLYFTILGKIFYN